MTPQTFVFFGRAGSGKGTQAKLLIDLLKEKTPDIRSLYLETGEKLREFISQDNHSAALTKEVLDTGGLMPAFMPIWLWTGFLVENFTGDEHIVLDGICRRKYEAPILDTALKFYKRPGAVIIIIDVSNDWSLQRLLSRGRHDDEIPEIRKRQEWYDTEVAEAMKYLESEAGYTTLHINGEQTIEEVHAEIVQKLGW
jgi:adenylate kinase family enzyme